VSERASSHLAHAEDRYRLEQRADPGADDLVGDLGGVLPGEDRLEPGGAALGQHRGDRAGEHVVGLVEQQRDLAPLAFGFPLLGLDLAVEQLEEQLQDELGVVFADGGLGGVDDQHLAPLDDAGEVDLLGVTQQQIGFAGGDQPLDLVARRVERLGGEAAV
jgi:hypothetical protein